MKNNITQIDVENLRDISLKLKEHSIELTERFYNLSDSQLAEVGDEFRGIARDQSELLIKLDGLDDLLNSYLDSYSEFLYLLKVKLIIK